MFLRNDVPEDKTSGTEHLTFKIILQVIYWLKVLIPRIASGLNVKFAIFPEHSRTFTVGLFCTFTVAKNLAMGAAKQVK
jgi:hypothetical protein